jgi:hypothetical protein
MPNSSRFPLNGESSLQNSFKTKEEKPHYEYPEVIVIDDRSSHSSSSGPSETSNPSFKDQKSELPTMSSMFTLRIICAVGAVICLFLGIALLIASFVSLALATVFLFRHLTLNHTAHRLWKLSAHLIVSSMGFIIGIIHPLLGIGLMTIYFSFIGSSPDFDFSKSFIHRSFRGS